MKRMILTLMLLVLLVAVSSCTVHIKATELEIDSERQRVDNDKTYEVVAFGLFDE